MKCVQSNIEFCEKENVVKLVIVLRGPIFIVCVFIFTKWLFISVCFCVCKNCRRWSLCHYLVVTNTGASSEGMRGLHPHPLKSDSGCGAPLLKINKDLWKYLSHENSNWKCCLLVKNVLHICSPHPSWKNPNEAPAKVVNIAWKLTWPNTSS